MSDLSLGSDYDASAYNYSVGGGSSGWESWAQNISSNLLQGYANSQFQQPYELQKMQLQAYGSGAYGLPYIQGQPNMQLGIPTGWLLIGGAIALAVVMIKS
jgi:hypothetical protein